MTNPQHAIPLWRLLQLAAVLLRQVREGASATALLAGVDVELRPALQSLLYQALRSLGRAEVLRQQIVARRPPPAADALLCLALALVWDPQQAPYEAFTLVNQAVEAAKHTSAIRAQANFINAALRRFLREREALVALSDAVPLARWNHPTWWIEKLKQDHPQHWQTVLQASNQPGPMSLRINVEKMGLQAYLDLLAQTGIAATACGPYGVRLQQALPVQALPGFEQGWVSVQDAAAQLAAPLLLQGLTGTQNKVPLRLLDACAAPGGKTAHLLELAPQARVTALDIDPQRCERIGQNLNRLGLSAQVLAHDALWPQRWWDGELFDAILLDAPCTASGIVRRHPDIRWLRRPSDIAQLAALQAKLLKTLWPLLRPGGRLLYCTCSVFREEGEQQIQAFLAHNTEAGLMPSPGHLLPARAAFGTALIHNQPDDHDGFYYALLEQRAA